MRSSSSFAGLPMLWYSTGVIEVRRLKNIEKYSGFSYFRLYEISFTGRVVVVSSSLPRSVSTPAYIGPARFR